MPKQKPTNQEQVTAYIQKLEQPLAETITFLRQIILETDGEIAEHIKWNSPSFYYSGEMKPFDSKEYKRDLLVLNIHRKENILIVFPTGDKISGTSGFFRRKLHRRKKACQNKRSGRCQGETAPFAKRNQRLDV